MDATMTLTKQDLVILRALDAFIRASSREIARRADLQTSSPTETAARHLIRATKLGLAEQVGTRMFPLWRITPAGRSALDQRKASA
jgi:hypothetical protein